MDFLKLVAEHGCGCADWMAVVDVPVTTTPATTTTDSSSSSPQKATTTTASSKKPTRSAGAAAAAPVSDSNVKNEFVKDILRLIATHAFQGFMIKTIATGGK